MVLKVRIKKELFAFSVREDFSSALLIKLLFAIALITLVATVPGWAMLIESYEAYVSLREIGVYLLNTTLILLLLPFFAVSKPPATLEKIMSMKTKGKTVPTSKFLASISLLSTIIALSVYLAIAFSGLY